MWTIPRARPAHLHAMLLITGARLGQTHGCKRYMFRISPGA